MHSRITDGRRSAIPAVLVVEPDKDTTAFLAALLRRAGFRVTTANTFDDARASLDAEAPDALISEVRLGTHNGLHLVILGRMRRPDMITVATSAIHDPVLKRDAESLGATFLQKPIATDRLLAALSPAARR